MVIDRITDDQNSWWYVETYMRLIVPESMRSDFRIYIAAAASYNHESGMATRFDLDEAFRLSHGPPKDSNNSSDEKAAHDFNLPRPQDFKAGQLGPAAAVAPFPDERGVADLLAALKAQQDQVKANIMRALGRPVKEEPKVDPRLDRSTWSPAFRAQCEAVEREYDECMAKNRSLGLL